MTGDTDLLPGEKIEIETRPHFFSFLKYDIFCVYLLVLTGLISWFYSYIRLNTSTLGFFYSILEMIPWTRPEDSLLLVLFWTTTLLSGFIIGLLWITKKPLVLLVTVGAVGIYLEFFSPNLVDPNIIPRSMLKLVLLGGISVVGIFLIEIYRRGHTYVLTNYRIIMKKKFVTTLKREIMYDRITDLYVSQGILGKILNFGTVMPISASGLGLGEDSSYANLFGSTNPTKRTLLGTNIGGGKSVKIPRAPTYFSLYGVPNPRKIQVIIGNRQLEIHEASP